MQRISDYFNRIFELDLRSLGLFRFLIGFMAVIDTVGRFLRLDEFYTDLGMMSRSLFLEKFANSWSLSLHLISGESWIVSLIFIIHIICAVCFMLGYKTRVSNILLWLFTISVHNRFWYVNNGGDEVLRLMIFFSMFLPVSYYFSIDGISKEKPKVHTSFWTFSLLIQMSLVYIISYVLKDSHHWRSTYGATYIAFNLDAFNTFISRFLLKFPSFLKVLTFITIYLEGFGPLILLFAFSKKLQIYTRYITIFLFASLHLAIIATMHVGLFPYICIAMWLVLLPSHFWEKFVISKRELRIFYDQNCGFCKKTAYALKDFFLLENAVVAPQAVNYEISKLMEKENSWVLKSGDDTYLRFDGIIQLFKGVKILKPIAILLSIKPSREIGTLIYKFIANNRLVFSRFTKPINLDFEKVKLINSPLAETFGLIVIMSIVNWNLGRIEKLQYNRSPDVVNFVRYFHLYQNWGMFSPYPKNVNSWFIFEGEFVNGKKYDFFTESELYSFVYKKDWQKYVTAKEWRKFLLNLERRERLQEMYARSLCKRVNDDKGIEENDKLKTLKMFSMRKKINVNGKEATPTKKLLWKHFCLDKDWKEYQKKSKKNKS